MRTAIKRNTTCTFSTLLKQQHQIRAKSVRNVWSPPNRNCCENRKVCRIFTECLRRSQPARFQLFQTNNYYKNRSQCCSNSIIKEIKRISTCMVWTVIKIRVAIIMRIPICVVRSLTKQQLRSIITTMGIVVTFFEMYQKIKTTEIYAVWIFRKIKANCVAWTFNKTISKKIRIWAVWTLSQIQHLWEL